MSGYVANGVPVVATPLTGAETLLMDTNNAAGLAPEVIAVQTQQLRARDYQQSSPLTGATILAALGTALIQVTPAGTIAALTVTLPVAPVDGHVLKIFTTQTITTLTINPSAGQTINGTAVTTLSANTGVEYLYNASGAAWYRVG